MNDAERAAYYKGVLMTISKSIYDGHSSWKTIVTAATEALNK